MPENQPETPSGDPSTGPPTPRRSEAAQHAGTFAIFWVGVLVVMGVPAILKLLGPASGLLGSLVACLICWLAFAGLVAIGRHWSLRRRAVIILFGYFCGMLSFAWIYFFIYKVVDPDAFTITVAAVERRKAEQNLETDLPLLTGLAPKLADLEALRANPDAIMRARQAADNAKNDDETFVPVSDGRAIRFAKTWHAAKVPYTVDVLVVRTREGRHSLHDVEPTVEGRQSDPRVAGLANATTQEKATAIIEEWYNEVKRDHDRVAKSVADARAVLEGKAGRVRCEFFDFLYFSVVTGSTVGFGDIVPNSPWVRIVVMAEAILGVAYVTFNISLLWPEKDETGPTGPAPAATRVASS
jgi:hypothetical protein